MHSVNMLIAIWYMSVSLVCSEDIENVLRQCSIVLKGIYIRIVTLQLGTTLELLQLVICFACINNLSRFKRQVSKVETTQCFINTQCLMN